MRKVTVHHLQTLTSLRMLQVFAPVTSKTLVMGAKPIYGDDIKEEILELLRTGKTLSSICDGDKRFPASHTVIGWANEEGEFADRYARARLHGYQTMADQLLDVADTKGTDFQRNRLMVDTRKWLLSKALPKIYGDKLTLDGEVEVKKTYVIAQPEPDEE